MAKVRWTVGAQQDLRAIVEYIARDSPAYAAATAARIVEATRKLGRYPRLGRVVPEYEEPAIRELLVGNYRVVYRVDRGQPGIVAIVHASRDVLRGMELSEPDFTRG